MAIRELVGAAAYEKAEMYEYLMDEWKHVMFESHDTPVLVEPQPPIVSYPGVDS